MKVVIIGGGTAGSEVAWQLRKENKEAEIIILEKGGHTQYSPCALPYLVSGKIKKAEDILLFDEKYYQYNKIDLRLNSEVVDIDEKNKVVEYIKDGQRKKLDYSYLVLASGLKFEKPDIKGLDEHKFFRLKNINDALSIKKQVKGKERAVIVGAGYVGVELAEALNKLGLKVSLVEAKPEILADSYDKKISQKIKEKMIENGVEVLEGIEIKEIKNSTLISQDNKNSFDHLFLACGFKVDLSLAKKANLKCKQGVVVNDYNQSSDNNIFALGDIVESINFYDNQKTLSQLATTAVSQARVVSNNILKKSSKREKVLNTSVSKFGDLIFGSCGLTNKYCQDKQTQTASAFYTGKDKASYYPESKDFYVYLIADLKGKILGCQMAGYSDVAGNLNMVSLAIKNQLKLEEFIKSETCYNPAVSEIFDPVIVAAELCLKKLKIKNEK